MRSVLMPLVMMLSVLIAGCAARLPPVPENHEQVDRRIEKEVQAAIADASLTRPNDVRFSVDRGIVDLDGWVLFPEERYELEDAVDRIDGVRAVRNQLSVPSMGTPNRSTMMIR